MGEMPIPSEWSFDAPGVAGNFDRHVREQLPWYDLVTRAVGLIARHYVEAEGLIYDIGCSTGNMARELADVIERRRARLIGIDNSPAMRNEYTGGEFLLADAVDVDYAAFDLALCFLVLQFIPNARRQALMQKLLARVKPDGAVIIVDKFTPVADSPYIQTIRRRLTLQGKVLTGTPAEEVIAKELSLSGVQRPIDPLELFSGYKASVFFSFGEFGGWIIEGTKSG